jgi:hypothetical protein
MMTAQAEAARKALAAGGSAKEAMQTAQALTASYNRLFKILEQSKQEMFKIGELAALSGAANLMTEFESTRTNLLTQAENAVAGARTMRDNEALFKKTIAGFDSLRTRVAGADSFFAGRRETNEAEWIVIKSRMALIKRPDAAMPQDFFGEVGTLERLPDKIRSELAKLQPPAAFAGFTEAGNLANAALAKLTPLYNNAGKALEALKAAIDALKTAASNKPATPPPAVAKQPSPPEPAQKVKQPAKPAPKNDGRLPCGHLPGQCPTSGIQALNCRLKNGEISQR